MLDIRLIEKDTNIAELKMSKIPWDVVVNGIPYQVVRIEGYSHSINCWGGDGNNLWIYPRNSNPTYETLTEYYCDGCGVCWGYKYEPYNYIKQNMSETECYTTGGIIITRNDENFYFCRGGIDEAEWLLKHLEEHPLNLNEYGFAEKMIGRKVWWRSEPAIIKSWIEGQACIILEPDGIDKFTEPVDAEFVDDGEIDIKINIFNNQIWWFRNDD